MEKDKVLSHKSLYSETIDGGRINISCYVNSNTKSINIYTGFSKESRRPSKQLFAFTTEGTIISDICRVNENTNNISISIRFSKSGNGNIKNNTNCSSYLGIYIAERVLSYIYPNVKRMPYNNPGFDFICGRGFKIDVKSSCLIKSRPNTWGSFYINKNKTADYFLCLAFDNRNNLNPQHIWLIPGSHVNNKISISISKSTLKKWSKYEQSISEIISCCNTLREDNINE